MYLAKCQSQHRISSAVAFKAGPMRSRGMRRGRGRGGRVRGGIIDKAEACHLAEWEQEQPLRAYFYLPPLSLPPDQILGFNPAVPITIAALVIAVVDSTITVEDPFSRRSSRKLEEPRRADLIARKS